MSKRKRYLVQRDTAGLWWLYWIDARGRKIPEGSGTTKAQVLAQRD